MHLINDHRCSVSIQSLQESRRKKVGVSTLAGKKSNFMGVKVIVILSVLPTVRHTSTWKKKHLSPAARAKRLPQLTADDYEKQYRATYFN